MMRSRSWLSFVLLLALGVRIAWGVNHAGVIENEGAEYARLAQNLMAGRGYIGVVETFGTQLNFPPLYPLLIGVLSFPLGNVEVAARVLAVCFGLLTVAVLYLIAERLYGRTAAVLVSLAAALHPALIAMSVAVYSEGPFLALILLAAYFSLLALEPARRWAAPLSGAAFGFAYLTRPEGFLYVAAFACALVLIGAMERRFRLMLGRAALLVAAFAVVGAPYVAFLAQQTGQIRLEGKGSINFAIGQRMNTGMSYARAAYEVDSALNEHGIHLKRHDQILSELELTSGNVLTYILQGAKRNVRELYRLVLTEKAIGSPALPMLAVLGLFAAPWSRQRLSREIVLLAFGGTVLVTLLMVRRYDFRDFYPLLGLLLVWSAAGMEVASTWLAGTVQSLRRSAWRSRLIETMGGGLAVAAVVGLAFVGVPQIGEFRQGTFFRLKEAGLWISAQSPLPQTVADSGLVPTFYAGGRVQFLPECDSNTAIRYLDLKRPDFVVLRDDASRPYVRDWLRNGIPSTHAQRVYENGTTEDDALVIYRWTVAP